MCKDSGFLANASTQYCACDTFTYAVDNNAPSLPGTLRLLGRMLKKQDNLKNVKTQSDHQHTISGHAILYTISSRS